MGPSESVSVGFIEESGHDDRNKTIRTSQIWLVFLFGEADRTIKSENHGAMIPETSAITAYCMCTCYSRSGRLSREASGIGATLELERAERLLRLTFTPDCVYIFQLDRI